MKFLILLVVASVARAQTYVPQDTPEVAAAKAAHMAELAKAGLAAGVPYYPRGYVSIGVPVVTPEGFIAETPEVATARAAHLAAVAASTRAANPKYAPVPAPAYAPAPAYTPASMAYYKSYNYPVYRNAAPHAPYYYTFQNGASVFASASSPAAALAISRAAMSAAAPVSQSAAAPAAAPVVITPDGFVADTQEVYEAKLAHYQAHMEHLLGIS